MWRRGTGLLKGRARRTGIDEGRRGGAVPGALLRSRGEEATTIDWRLVAANDARFVSRMVMEAPGAAPFGQRPGALSKDRRAVSTVIAEQVLGVSE